MTDNRAYYSVRTGIESGKVSIDLDMLRKLFYNTFQTFFHKFYFQEAMGYYCTDEGFVAGTMGADPSVYSFMKLRKNNLFPIVEEAAYYSEHDIFDVIEFLYDHCSKPLKGYYHEWNKCGWHYHSFSQKEGKNEFRNEINDFLKSYGHGWELSEDGEILALVDTGLEELIDFKLPIIDDANVNTKIEHAIRKFRRYTSTEDDRKDAVRDLVDILEFIRPQVKKFLRDDEADLFHIANAFGIRHHKIDQKTRYDKDIFYTWLFYYYLAAINAALRLIARGGTSEE